MAKPPKRPADTEAGDGEGAPARKRKAKGGDTGTLHADIMKRWDAAYERERENIDLAYEDQLFRLGDQWDAQAALARRADSRPILTFNRLPQFVKQVTGDIRQMRPAIRVVGIDNRADKDTAEVIAGLVRYIEKRSDAERLYFQAADSQVACGIGAWRVVTEYASDSTFEQEIGVEGIEDPIAVLWDPDAIHPTRRDAKFCFVPVDMSREEFQEKYPDAQVSSVTSVGATIPMGWASDDFVRVAEYWVKKPIKRKLALMPGGGIDDLTDDKDGDAKEAEILAMGGRVEMRDGYRVERYVISGQAVLSGPEKWPGRYIPIVPVLGEEVRVGRRRYRHGIIRFAKDAQRTYNYFRSTQTEVVALQPKAPWIGTKDMFKQNKEMWATANIKNYPYLEFAPDPKAAGLVPQRVAPPVASSGLTEGVQFAVDDMKGVIGIYDASLGAKSNETSGRAILARQHEGDNTTFVYVDNFSLAVQQTGRIIVDLIPHVYDTTRTIRVIGEDGKVDLAEINAPQGVEYAGAVDKTLNDVTVGAYDVTLEMGPSYTTKREEAREGMLQLLQAVPDVAPLILDLVAKAQDWPLSDKIAKRIRTTLPPQIQAEEAAESGEEAPPMPPGPPPDPKAEAEVAKAQADVQLKDIELKIAEVRLAVETAKANAALATAGSEMGTLTQQIAMLTEAVDIMMGEPAGDDMPMPPDIPPDASMMPPEMMGEPPPMEAQPDAIPAMLADPNNGPTGVPEDFPPASA